MLCHLRDGGHGMFELALPYGWLLGARLQVLSSRATSYRLTALRRWMLLSSPSTCRLPHHTRAHAVTPIGIRCEEEKHATLTTSLVIPAARLVACYTTNFVLRTARRCPALQGPQLRLLISSNLSQDTIAWVTPSSPASASPSTLRMSIGDQEETK